MEEITKKFGEFGFKLVDWQKPDRAVGIMNGYVVFEYEGQVMEIDYLEACFFDTKEEILECSKLFIE